MIRVNPSSINDLLLLEEAGAPVTLTSHPGNASLYKLSLWQCGVPEHFWDLTCCVADANNWPMFRLRNGEAELLVNQDLHQKIRRETGPNRRFATAYQMTATGERLGRVHVRECERLFPGVLSSCSRLLLSELGNVMEVFGYLAEVRPRTAFGRYVTSDGVLVPIEESGLKPHAMADSFMNVLRELDHLLFSDEPIITKGGACYDGVLVPLLTMLVQFWNTGRIDRYDVSGPDMIHYAMKPAHQEKLSEMLRFLHQWNPRFIPPTIIVRMFPGTVARVGHVPGHVSESVMTRKINALRFQNKLHGDHKRRMWEVAKDDESHWPIQIKASQEAYFSQYDLTAHGGRIAVDDFWKDIPLESMWKTLSKANALLRLK